MHVFAISLPESRGRRSALTDQCRRYGLEPEIIDAIRGTDLTREEISTLVAPDAAQVYSPSEIGCALSHIKVFDIMAARNIPRALILEDDAIFCRDPRPFLHASEIYSRPEERKSFLLSPLKVYIKNYPLVHEGLHLYPCLNSVGSHAYVLTLGAARALAEFSRPVRALNDMWKYFMRNSVIQCYVSDTEFCSQSSWLAPQQTTLGDRDALLKTAQRHEYHKKLMRQSFDKMSFDFMWKLFRRPFLTVVNTTLNQNTVAAALHQALPGEQPPGWLVPSPAGQPPQTEAGLSREKFCLRSEPAASHRDAWRRMLSSGQNTALVIEQSCVMNSDPALFIRSAAGLAGDTPDVFLMTLRKRYSRTAPRHGSAGEIFYPAVDAADAQAYVISAAAARALDQALPPDVHSPLPWRKWSSKGVVNLWVSDLAYIAPSPGEAPIIPQSRQYLADNGADPLVTIIDTMGDEASI